MRMHDIGPKRHGRCAAYDAGQRAQRQHEGNGLVVAPIFSCDPMNKQAVRIIPEAAPAVESGRCPKYLRRVGDKGFMIQKHAIPCAFARQETCPMHMQVVSVFGVGTSDVSYAYIATMSKPASSVLRLPSPPFALSTPSPAQFWPCMRAAGPLAVERPTAAERTARCRPPE